MAKKEETSYHGLDHVLNSTEFETSQQEQAIQNELDKIQAHEKEIEEKEREMKDFESVTDDVESRREKALRQLQLNRDNIESLKHTVTVLDEHLEALNKSYQSAVQKTQNISTEYDAAVVKYTEKWEHFQTTYRKMPKAQELSSRIETLNQIKAEETALDCEILEIQKTINAMKSEDWEATVKWVLQIATVRVETEAIIHLLRSTRQAVHECKSRQALKPLLTKTTKEGEEMSVDTQAEEEMEEEEKDTPPSTAANTTPMDVGSTFNDETSTVNAQSSDTSSNYLPTTSEQSKMFSSQQQKGSSVPERRNPPPGPALSQAVEIEESQTANTSKENLELCKRFGVFVRPQAPPRRFTIPKPSPKQNTCVTTAVQSLANTPVVTEQPVNTHTSVVTSAVSGRVSVIPHVYQIQSPKPPVPSPKLSSTSSSSASGKTKFTFELPKFSLPPPSYVASSAPPSDPQKSSHMQSNRVVQASNNQKEQTVTSIKAVPAPSITSYQKQSGVTELTAQLKMPPRPVLPPPSQPSARISSSSVALSFTLPSLQPPQVPKATSSSHALQQRQQSDSGGNNTPQEKPPPNTHSSGEQEAITSKAVPTVPEISSLTTTPQEDPRHSHQQQQKQYKNQKQTLVHEVQYISHQQAHPVQELETQEDMEVMGDHVTGEGREDGDRGDLLSFDPAHTSIDFGEQSVDFDSSGPLFALPADDSFNMSQTGSFFNTNQVHSGGSYNFMEMSMNEEESSSTTNLQDFFSQFGKTTSSSTEAGKFLF